MLLTELTLKTFIGPSIKPYLHSIARLSVEVFQEYPYFCDTHIENEIDALQKYPQCDSSIAVILFEGSKVVGAATGLPMHQESSFLQTPLISREINPKTLFHFGEALLLRPYRGRGVGHHFYEIREEYARKLGYEQVCFYMKDTNESEPLRPPEFYPLDEFWRKRGFVHHREIKLMLPWKDLFESSDSLKECSYWIKKL
ncbi:MAG: GNAT family N-acetyltransferase [Chlamydiae bacterium]|nr:GNAT family N-acetyltransferase [Chlamydiota bacterium]